MMGRRAVPACLARNGMGGDVSLIEGVMGYYDGQPFSTADLSALVKAPAIIAIDAAGAAESCAATALGFIRYRRRSGIRAFILNRVFGASHYAMAASAVERATGLPVIGYLPNDPALAMTERHLGLAGDATDFRRIASALAEAVAAHIDLDALLAIAASAPA
jgi:cobyrinic acid a,c-diamide synthase